MIEVNVRAKTMKLSEEDLGINLHDLALGNGFRYGTKSTNRKNQIDWTSLKLKAFVLPKTLSVK